ncbi:hypothetical protein ACFU8Q_31020 [Streptomyces sp. NPDC057543]|uniref:hypothetical protein n=1 Tax=Streptomyces sp. NPDC057543 TaxID=3346163 RepID=UPI003693D8AE
MGTDTAGCLPWPHRFAVPTLPSDKRLRQAIVDRLTFEAHIIETGTQSFRLTSTTAKRKAAAA